MAKTVKYIPLWHVTVKGVTYSPARDGEPLKVIEGLSEAEIKRLLDMGAIKALTFEEESEEAGGLPGGELSEGKPFEDMTMAELRSIAKERGVSAPVTISRDKLLEALTTQGEASAE